MSGVTTGRAPVLGPSDELRCPIRTKAKSGIKMAPDRSWVPIPPEELATLACRLRPGHTGEQHLWYLL